ncbi:hypothetical protein DEJ51_20140 [Streptomyces venezuelae]|uniref:Uncharacterized protein n=1 Tax=Streptomyces venezuelae TaxID=54571 RepID=A0A5P2DPT3_STRVZ|nr:hypothetical protein [Streptomyces venezuelae]QES56188.1 hypothetical protein DEJ51_20140 [Streptomyces venezuelae]
MTWRNAELRWRDIISITVGLVIGISAFALAGPRLTTKLTGVEGSFRAEQCGGQKDYDGVEKRACTGSFTAADGSFTIHRIAAEGLFDTDPAGPVPSRVAGPSATEAVRPGLMSLAPLLGIGAIGFAYPLWVLIAVTRDLLTRRRRRRGVGRAGAGAAAGAGDAAPVTAATATATSAGSGAGGGTGRTNSGVRWIHAVPIALGIAVGIYMCHAAVPRLITQLTGVEGTFRAEHCAWGEPDSDGERAMRCTGDFTAADGSFTLAGVKSDGTFDERPKAPVSARASGPSADHAVQMDFAGSLAPIGMGLTAFAFPAWALTAATRDALDRRRRRRADPPDTVAPDPGSWGPLPSR